MIQIWKKGGPEYEGKEDDYCSHCGWKYDLYQFEDTDSHDICPFYGWEDDELMESEPSKW